MPVDPGRQEQHERLIVRFIYEPDFRIRFWKDPEKLLTEELGELTELELCWLKGLMFGRTQQDELINQLQGDEVRPQAW